jgi:hypothetical protein
VCVIAPKYCSLEEAVIIRRFYEGIRNQFMHNSDRPLRIPLEVEMILQYRSCYFALDLKDGYEHGVQVAVWGLAYELRVCQCPVFEQSDNIEEKERQGKGPRTILEVLMLYVLGSIVLSESLSRHKHEMTSSTAASPIPFAEMIDDRPPPGAIERPFGQYS